MSETFETVLSRANELFGLQNYEAANEKYQEALRLCIDPGKKEEIREQILKCNEFLDGDSAVNAVAKHTDKPKVSKSKLAKLKDKLGGSLNIGNEIKATMMRGLIKKFKPHIEKNKPMAAAFMRGEIDIQGNPIPEGQTPRERIVIIERYPDPGGDPLKDDTIVHVRYKDMVKFGFARDNEGKDISLEISQSIMFWIEKILDGTIEKAMQDPENIEDLNKLTDEK